MRSVGHSVADFQASRTLYAPYLRLTASSIPNPQKTVTERDWHGQIAASICRSRWRNRCRIARATSRRASCRFFTDHELPHANHQSRPAVPGGRLSAPCPRAWTTRRRARPGFNFFSAARRAGGGPALPRAAAGRRASSRPGCSAAASSEATGSPSWPRPRPSSSRCSSPASMPARAGTAALVHQHRRPRRLCRAAARHAAVGAARGSPWRPPDLSATLREAAAGTAVRRVATAAEIAAWAPVRGAAASRSAPTSPATSSTARAARAFPRGVLVTQRAIAANARAIAVHGLALGSGDRCTSWLPLYHDMGLVGCCLTPVMTQITVDYLPSTAFARRPLLWLKLLSDLGGTISFGPTFGYELCTRRAQAAMPEGLDLSRWRVAGIGGEMIRANVLDEFARPSPPPGFDAGAFLPSYGLAEATLAVTFAPRGAGVVADTVRQGRTARGRAPRGAGERVAAADGSTRSFVLCGRPMAGYAVEIRDGHGRALPERAIGRVCIKGPSLMSGYFHNDVATRGRAARRRLARHGRPRLPDRRRARDHRPQQGPDHRRRPQHLAAGRRVGGRAAGRRARRRRRRLRGRRRRRARGGGGRGPVPRRHARGAGRPARRGRRRGAQGRRRRVRGGAGADALAHLHHLGQAEPGRGARPTI